MTISQFSNFTPKLDYSLADEDATYEVCIANISPAERLKRLKIAIFQFAFGAIVLGLMLFLDVEKVWRLTLFVVFASAGATFFQWRDKTWIALAARGLRKLTDEEEKIEDQSQVRQIRLQALKVIGKGVLVSLGITLIIMLLP